MKGRRGKRRRRVIACNRSDKSDKSKRMVIEEGGEEVNGKKERMVKKKCGRETDLVFRENARIAETSRQRGEEREPQKGLAEECERFAYECML